MYWIDFMGSIHWTHFVVSTSTLPLLPCQLLLLLLHQMGEKIVVPCSKLFQSPIIHLKISNIKSLFNFFGFCLKHWLSNTDVHCVTFLKCWRIGILTTSLSDLHNFSFLLLLQLSSQTFRITSLFLLMFQTVNFADLNCTAVFCWWLYVSCQLLFYAWSLTCLTSSTLNPHHNIIY